MRQSSSSSSWLKSTALAVILSASLVPASWAAGLQARINSSMVAMGDSFQLTLTTQDMGARQPDLAPLAHDFKVLGTSQSSQTQIINGRRLDQKSWIVTLSPKKKGELTIPVIHAGSVSSDIAKIKVLDASQAPKAIGVKGVSVTASLEQGQHYVFAEIPLTVRIEADQPLEDAALVAPQGDNFELSQVGQDRSSQVVRNGRPVTVIERSYLLRPQKAGPLTLPPFVLKGSVADPRQRRDPFFDDFGFGGSMMRNFGMGRMFRSGKPFKVRSDALSLSVLDNPKGASPPSQDWFLPAKAVKLQAKWTQPTPRFKVGEAVTRRVSLLALGARPEQLPDLDLGSAAGVKLYLDDSKSDLIQSPEGSVARKDILVSVVPTQSGDVTLPEIRVTWLDTQSNTEKTAVLPAQTLHVEGAAPASTSPQSASSPPDPIEDAGPSQSALQEVSGRLGGLEIWHWGALSGGLVILALGAYGWQSVRRPAKRSDTKLPTKYGAKPAQARQAEQLRTQKEALSKLQAIVKSGDANKSYQALMVWLRVRPQSLNDHELQIEIAKLEQHLFANTPATGEWDKRALQKILDRQTAAAKVGNKGAILPELYPSISH